MGGGWNGENEWRVADGSWRVEGGEWQLTMF